jgi:type IV pilus assembly protein PilO
MAMPKSPNIDLSRFTEQFRGLQGRHPGLWPALPRTALLCAVLGCVLALAWAGFWRDQLDELDAGRAREEQLRAQYVDKLKQAVNLDVLRKQKDQVMQYVSALEKQLPSKAEMDALLSDINQAGVGRGLQFELFKPGQVVVREFYAELPISIKLVGDYHDLGAFTSDVSNLARIVTLNDMQITQQEKTGQLTMEAVAKTFRYLDSEEIAEQRRQAAKAKQNARPGATAPAARSGAAK